MWSVPSSHRGTGPISQLKLTVQISRINSDVRALQRLILSEWSLRTQELIVILEAFWMQQVRVTWIWLRPPSH